MPTTIAQFFDLWPLFWSALQHGDVLPLGNWNYVFLYFFVIIQGPLVKLLSGAVSAATYLKLPAVILVSITASLTADTGWYFVGRFGKTERFLRKNNDRRKKVVDILQTAMQQHYFKVALLGKLSPGLAVPSILAAGISNIPWRKWFPVVLLGESIYTSVLVMVGFFAAESINHANQTVKMVGIAFTAVFILILVFYLPYTIRKTLMAEHPGSNQPIEA